MIMLLVGRILKVARAPLTYSQKSARIRHKGELKRVCGRHQAYLQPGTMAVLDETNCQFCKMVKEIEDEYGNRV